MGESTVTSTQYEDPGEAEPATHHPPPEEGVPGREVHRCGSATPLCDCEPLPCRQEPACEEFLQIMELYGVKGFEDGGDPDEKDPQPAPVVAGADATIIAKTIERALTRKPSEPAGSKREGRVERSTAPWASADVSAFEPPDMKRVNDEVADVIEGMRAMAGTTPPSALPICQDVELALVVRYRQCWTPLGYSRGDLINSISLAPGEELTLEVFTWDRHRIERERSRDSSRESSESISVTSRISSELVANMQFKVGAGADAKVGGSLSLAGFELPIDVTGDIGGNFNTELSTSITSTTATVNEATVQASHVQRSSQKTRVVEVSEIGSESRSTRRLKNENRCHTINYDYFEILEHYDVCTEVVDARLVARVPLPPPPSITVEWLLCHEHPLRKHLLDALYEAGFDAAALLRTAEIYRLMSAPPPAAVPATDTSQGQPATDALGDQLRIILDAMVQAVGRLQGVSNLSTGEYGDVINLFSPNHDAAMAKASKLVTRDYVTSAMPGLFDRIAELNAHRGEPGPALFGHFDVFVSQLDSVSLMNLTTVALGGNAELRWDTFPLLVFGYDDEGVIGAVNAAHRKVEALRPAMNAGPAPAAALPTATAPAIASGPKSEIERLDDQFGLGELAAAQVEVDRLICHIKDYLDHYLTVLFLYEGPASWSTILDQCPQAVGEVDQRVVAIQDGYAYFDLRRSERSERAAAKLGKLIEELREEQKDKCKCITLTTPGTTLEARLGRCSACEEFIEQHRAYDLRLKREEVRQAVEKTRQETAEADRQAARLTQDPPLLEDPDVAPGPIHVVLETRPAAPPTP